VTDVRLQNRRCNISPTHRASSFSVLDTVLRSHLRRVERDLEELPSARSALRQEHAAHAGERNPSADKSFGAESHTEERHSCCSATHQPSLSCPKS